MTASSAVRTAAIAWLMAAIFYFYQYALRSAPAVMIPELSEAFGLGAMGVASLVGLFYYGYSPFSLVAGVAMDRFGPRRVMPIGALAVGLGALLFSSGSAMLAGVGRILQGAGGAFALIGAVLIATRSFPASRAATLIGATQMFGMAGGSVGQFGVGPLIAGGVSWSTFWIGMAAVSLAIAAPLFLLIPPAETLSQRGDWVRSAVKSLGTVFRNPQSILCGSIAGLLALPTTVFDMVWGVRYLQEAIGFDYTSAVIRSATVPVGWIVGSPLLGFVSDRIGRRKPVIVAGALVLFACLAWILFGPAGLFPPYLLGLATGVASGAVMLPYTVVKETNPPDLGGTATGVVNFLNFTLSALLGPVFAWILRSVSGGAATLEHAHYQTAFQPLLAGIGLAILLTLLLKETGPAVRPPAPAPARGPA